MYYAFCGYHKLGAFSPHMNITRVLAKISHLHRLDPPLGGKKTQHISFHSSQNQNVIFFTCVQISSTGIISRTSVHNTCIEIKQYFFHNLKCSFFKKNI